MTKKTATKTRSRVRINARKTPHRGIETVVSAAKRDAAALAELKDNAAAPQEWQTIQVPAPPGIYAGIDHDGNGFLFRRVDTHMSIGQIVTHLESLIGERIAASSVAQFTGPLPEFGENPQFGMNILVSVPKKD